jgi:hypothetical protein
MNQHNPYAVTTLLNSPNSLELCNPKVFAYIARLSAFTASSMFAVLYAQHDGALHYHTLSATAVSMALFANILANTTTSASPKKYPLQ